MSPWRKIVVALTLLFVASQAHAQTKGECFEIVSPGQNVQPFSLVLLNKCNGLSWILTKEAIADAKGHPTRNFTYRWAPLAVNRDEATLAFPTQKEILQQMQ